MNNRLTVSVISVTVGIILAASLIPAQALTTGFVIDFETLSDGVTTIDHGLVIDTEYTNQIPNGPIGLGVTIYADNYNHPINAPEFNTDTNDPNDPAPFSYPTLANIDNYDLPVIFDSDVAPAGVEDQDLLATFTTDFPVPANRLISPLPPGCPNSPNCDHDPGNILIIQDDSDVNTRCPDPDELNPPPPLVCINTNADDEGARPAGQFIFVFSKEVILKSIDVFDIDADETDPTDIHFFDANNNFIGSSQILSVDSDPNNPPSGDNKWRQVDLMQIGVKTMVIELAGSGGIDNIVYDLPVGGSIIPIDTISLFLKSQTSVLDALITITMIASGIFGIFHFTKTRKQN